VNLKLWSILLVFCWGLTEGANPPELIRFKPWELVNAVAWSPDGQILAASAGNQVYLYQRQNKQRIALLSIGALTQALFFSPDGSLLAAGSRDGLLRIWTISEKFPESGEGVSTPTWQVIAHKKGVNSLSFSPDGRLLASGGNDGMARVWEAKTGNQISAMIGGAFSIPGLAFSPDGTTLAIMNSNMIRLRDLETKRIIGSLRAENPLYSIAYHPDGSLIAAGDSNGQILLWDPAKAYRTSSLAYPKPVILQSQAIKSNSSSNLIWRLNFSPDGRQLASASGDGTVRLWDVKRHDLLLILSDHRGAVTSLAFSPDGKQLASGSLDATVRIWDLPVLK
jgi:WD40 repeat protein